MESGFYRLLYRTKSEEEWLTENDVLRRASPRVTRPTENFPYARFKIGDGRTPWAKAPHFKPHIDATLITPSPVFPFNKETVSLDVLYFEITPFESFYNIPQKGIDLQASTDPLFINKIYNERHFGTLNQVKAPKDIFEDNKTYYWRMQYIDQENFISGWTPVYSFTVQKISPLIKRPRILEPTTAELFTTEPIITLSEFESLLSTDVHVATHYQIATDMRFINLVYDTVTLDDLTRTRVPEDVLEYDTTYYIRARQSSGNDRWSSWSNRVRIRSHQLTIIPPRILTPTESSLLLDDILVQLSRFETDPPNRDIHIFTHYKVTDDNPLTPPVYERVTDTDLRNVIIPSAPLQPFVPYTLQVRYKGSRTDWSEWVTFSFQVKTPQIKTPEIIRPSGDDNISLEAILETSPFTVLNTNDDFEHVGTRFQIARDRDFERMVHDTGVGSDLIQHTVPDGLLDPSTTYFIRVRHKGDGLGWSLWSDTVQAVTVDPMIAQPRVLNPDADDDDVILEPTLETSPFRVLFDTDTHAATQYQLFDMDNPDLCLYDIIAHVDLIEHDLPFDILDAETTYGIRVRHKGNRFSWSAWSPTVKFTTRLPDIITPSVLRPIDNDVLDAPVVIQTSEFETQTSDDEHIETHYQIATDTDFTTIVYQTQDKDDLLIHTVPEETLFQEDMYYVRVRHRGNVFGWSEWSEQVLFSILDTAPLVEETDEINGRILARVARPDITEPTAETGLTNQTFRIMTSPFDVINGTDEQIASQYQVRRISDNVIVYDSGPVNDFEERRIRGDQLSFDTPYRVRARHKGRDLNWSEWSLSNRFTLVPSAETLIQRPSIEDPTASETVSRKSLTIDTSPFAVANASDTHVASQYRIARIDADEGDFVYDSNETTEDLISRRVSESQLSPDVVYRVWARHKGESLGWSDWSLPRIFDTLVKEGPYLERPEILSPNDDADVPSDSITVHVSPFDIQDGSDTQIATQYRIFDAATNDIVYDSGSVTDFTSRDVPETQLPFGNDYLVQARHQGEVVGWSKWSPTVRFTSTFAEDPFIEKPRITSPDDGTTVPKNEVVIDASPFVVIGQNDTQTATQYVAYQGTDDNVIYDSGATEDFESRSLTSMTIDFETPVTVKIRHRGETLGWSDWSEPVSFTVDDVQQPFIATPIINDPSASNSNTVPEDDVEITTTPFTVIEGDFAGSTDTHFASQYKVRDANDNVVHDSGPTRDLTSHIIPENELELDTPYTVTTRHLGEDLGWSDWSDPELFTIREVIDPFIATPTIDSPSDGETVPENALEIMTSDFIVVNDSDDHDGSRYQIQDIDGNVVHDSGTIGDLTAHVVPRNTVTPSNSYRLRARHLGNTYGWSEWSDPVTFIVEEAADSFIGTPTVSLPNDPNTANPNGVFENDIRVTTSPFVVEENGTDTHSASQYQIRDTNNEIAHDSGATDDLINHTVPENTLMVDTEYSVIARHLGEDLGWSDWSDPVTFIVEEAAASFIRQPSATLPNIVPEDSIDVTTSSFDIVGDDTDTHVATEYRIQDTNGNTIHTSGPSDDLIAHTIPPSEVTAGNTYILNVRHLGEDLGWSSWSPDNEFTVEAVPDDFVEKPVINTPSPNGPPIPEDSIEIVTDPFSVSSGTDEHTASRYRIQNINDDTDSHDSGPTTDRLSHIVPEGALTPNNDYMVTVRHFGQRLGWSDWSNGVIFRVEEAIDSFVRKPSASFPNNATTVPEDNLVITTSPFRTMGETDTHIATEYRVNDTGGNTVHSSGSSNDLTTHTISENTLTPGNQYTLTVRHEGQTLGKSAWSDPVSFTVEEVPEGHIAAPDITKPSPNEEVFENDIRIETSPFVVIDGMDEHAESQYQIRTTDNNIVSLDDIVYDSGLQTNDLTEHTVPENNTLMTNTSYYVVARHQGRNFEWSEWSDPMPFTLKEALVPFIVKPSIEEPLPNDQVLEDSIRIRTSSFDVMNGQDTPMRADYEILRADDNSSVHTSTETSAITTHDVAENVLEPGVTYKVRARHDGENLPWSEWSDFVLFTVEAVAVPLIARPRIDVLNVNGDLLSDTSRDVTLAVNEFTLELSEFTVINGADILEESQYKITPLGSNTPIHDVTLTDTFDMHTPPSGTLNTNTTYVVNGRYKGRDIGWSEWSTPVTISVQSSVLKPQVIDPDDGATGVPVRPTIKTSTFRTSNSDGIAHISTEYNILDLSDPAVPSGTLSYESKENSPDLIEHRVPVGSELQPNRNYKVRVRHKGAVVGYSLWSDFASFTTAGQQGSELFTTNGTFTVPSGVTSVSAVVVPGTGTASFGTHITQEPDTWDPLPDLDWETLGDEPYRWSQNGGFDTNGNYWVVGGRTGFNELLTDTVSFNPSDIQNGWQVHQSLPEGRRDHASVIDNDGFLWVINGFILSVPAGTATDTVWRLNTRDVSANWERLDDGVLNRKLNNSRTVKGFDFHQAALDLDNHIWVLGGRDGGVYNYEIYKITPDETNPIVETSPSLRLSTGRQQFDMTVDRDGYLWVCGGESEDPSQVPDRSVWRFDTKTTNPTWEEMPPLPNNINPKNPLLVTGPDNYIYFVRGTDQDRTGLLRLDLDNPQDGWHRETPAPLEQEIRWSNGFIDSNMRFWVIGGRRVPGVMRANLASGPNQMKGTSFDISGTQIELGGPHGSDGQILKWENNIDVSDGTDIQVTVSAGDSAVRVIWGPGISFPNNMT